MRSVKMPRRGFAAVGLLVVVAGLGGACTRRGNSTASGSPADEVRVGVLHSLSGTMAISEKSVADATLMAIEEINEQGGVLGKKIRPIIVDGRSDGPTFAREAEHLIVDEKVSVVFGCWTSASRKTVKPVFEKYNHLLFYPVQYEGLEQSPNIVYTGAAPNQQIIPAVKWTYDNLGKRMFLVGSDQVFAHSANAIIKDQVAALKGEIVGEEYIMLGSRDVKVVVEKIVQSKPTVILNTISGDSNVAFFSELRRAGITPDKIPTMSFSVAEEELRSMNVKDLVGDYASRNYFQSQTNPENLEFVQRFKAKYGQERVTDDPIEAAYFGVYVWAQTARAAGSVNVDSVRATIPNQNYNAPEGPIFIDAENNHTWRTVRIGKIGADGQFAIVWDSQKPLRPVPYPIYRTKAEWEKFLTDLFVGWQQHWAKPAPGPG